ncbi:MAG TPA: hypothetical protein VKM55_24485 [Candidatus Lokiarchaeia archaeon]|nr:hypothetical protein [Candidatus Lokiarchaeia archaeon]
MTTQNQTASDHIYVVVSEEVVSRPKLIFESTGVYIIIDDELHIIWIWSGTKSKLFYRYTAANWAGKQKLKKRFSNYRHELVRQGFEPTEFKFMVQKLHEQYPYICMENFEVEELSISKDDFKKKATELPASARQQDAGDFNSSQFLQYLNEIKEFQAHIRYLCDQIDRKIYVLEGLIGKDA